MHSTASPAAGTCGSKSLSEKLCSPKIPSKTRDSAVRAGNGQVASRNSYTKIMGTISYSVRSAFIGSIDAARRAGISPATHAATTSVRIAPIITLASAFVIS